MATYIGLVHVLREWVACEKKVYAPKQGLPGYCALMEAAADTIEELDAKYHHALDDLVKAQEPFKNLSKPCKMPKTNADRIRSMSDKALAEEIIMCRDADVFREEVMGRAMMTAEEWLVWLQEEVKV